jgi:thiol-disulfide isomerase/thioredoxin
MNRLAVVLLACLLPLAAQDAKESKDPKEAKEERDLEEAVAEAGSSPVEYAKALERHLKKYPNTKQRAEIERVLVQAAIDARNKRMLVLYGVAVLDRGSDDPVVLDHVSRALLDTDDPAAAAKALKYTRQLESSLGVQYQRLVSAGGLGKGARLDDMQQRIARSQAFQARALGTLGKFPEAAEAGRKGYATYATAEGAREAAKWMEKAGQLDGAIDFYAEAFSFSGTDSLRVRDRERLAELYRKQKGSDAGLGDVTLAAFDRMEKQVAAQRARIKELDPNVGALLPFDFTLSGLQGDKFALNSLKGKVTVLDFWATWCRPCRSQHPLYEQVRAKFKNRDDVVFLAVNTDEDREVVSPFLDAQKWDKKIYFEDGLQNALRVNSIPTTVVLDRQGGVVSRMNGFIPERFVDMLALRIEEALAEK